MRSSSILSVAVSVLFLANNALAQQKGKGGKGKSGASAAATWTDPTETEKSDKGPYAPKSEAEPPPEAVAKPKPEKPAPPDPGRKRDKLLMFGQIVIGFGEAPLNNPGYVNTAKGTVVGFQVGGRYDLTKAFSLGLRVPLSTATVRQVNGKNLSSTAFGSPELLGEYRVQLGKLSQLPIYLGFGIPVAGGNADRSDRGDTEGLSKDTVQRLADATTGWKDSELFQPERMPIVLGVGFRHERRDWELHADAKFVLLPALDKTVANPQSEPPGTGTYVINSFAMREVTVFGASYNFLDKPTLYGGLDLALVWTPIETFDFEPADKTNKPSKLQAVLEPKIGVRFPIMTPSIGYVAPLGGRLGDGDIGGVRLLLDVHP